MLGYGAAESKGLTEAWSLVSERARTAGYPELQQQACHSSSMKQHLHLIEIIVFERSCSLHSDGDPGWGPSTSSSSRGSLGNNGSCSTLGMLEAASPSPWRRALLSRHPLICSLYSPAGCVCLCVCLFACCALVLATYRVPK